MLCYIYLVQFKKWEEGNTLHSEKYVEYIKTSAAAILRKEIFGWSLLSFNHFSLFSKFSFNYALDRKTNFYVLTFFRF